MAPTQCSSQVTERIPQHRQILPGAPSRAFELAHSAPDSSGTQTGRNRMHENDTLLHGAYAPMAGHACTGSHAGNGDYRGAMAQPVAVAHAAMHWRACLACPVSLACTGLDSLVWQSLACTGSISLAAGWTRLHWVIAARASLACTGWTSLALAHSFAAGSPDQQTEASLVHGTSRCMLYRLHWLIPLHRPIRAAGSACSWHTRLRSRCLPPPAIGTLRNGSRL